MLNVRKQSKSRTNQRNLSQAQEALPASRQEEEHAKQVAAPSINWRNG